MKVATYLETLLQWNWSDKRVNDYLTKYVYKRLQLNIFWRELPPVDMSIKVH